MTVLQIAGQAARQTGGILMQTDSMTCSSRREEPHSAFAAHCDHNPERGIHSASGAKQKLGRNEVLHGLTRRRFWPMNLSAVCDRFGVPPSGATDRLKPGIQTLGL